MIVCMYGTSQQQLIAHVACLVLSCLSVCRAVIHSVLRYGRILRYAGLRVLERKNNMHIDRLLSETNNNTAGGALNYTLLRNLLMEIRKGPFTRVLKTNNEYSFNAMLRCHAMC